MLQESFGNSFVHKAYSEFRVWLCDNMDICKIQFLTQH